MKSDIITSDERVERFEHALGSNLSSGLTLLRTLEWAILPFNAVEQREEDVMQTLVRAGYTYPDFWYRVYFINDTGLAVVDAYKGR